MLKNNKKTLDDDIMGAKFGTKNRAELILRTARIRKAVKEILYMARRYADGRLTGAPDNFNSAYDVFRQEFGDWVDDQRAQDMTGTKYYDIALEHTKDHPYATYGDGSHIDSHVNRDLADRKFYKKP